MRQLSGFSRPAVIAVWVIGIIAAAALGLTTYTMPSHASAPYSRLASGIHKALRDPPEPGPVRGEPLPVSGEIPDSIREFVRAVAGTAAAAAPAIDSAPDLPWAIEAARRDSAALRLWLGPAVWVTGTMGGDSTRLTLRRLFLRSGCPILSALHATLVTTVPGDLRIVAVVADCPAGLGAGTR